MKLIGGVSALSLKAAGYDKKIQSVIGQHHGFMPSVGLRNASDECFGGEAWQSERDALFQALVGEFDVSLPESLTDVQVRVISGLTSVADRIRFDI